MIMVFKDRNEMMEHIVPSKKVAEIGVFKGEFSDFIYKLKPESLHLIDIFEGGVSSGDKDGQNIQSVDLGLVFNQLKEKYKKDDSVKVIKGLSSEILPSYEDNFFDIIYIDGSHIYEDVKVDLENAYKKVKIGGWIAGHDYHPQVNPGIYFAVGEFLMKHSLHLDGIAQDALPSFLIKKSK